MTARNSLRDELAGLLNRHSKENASNTPDFILAQYMLSTLGAFDAAVRQRERWYGEFREPGGIQLKVPEMGSTATQPRFDNTWRPQETGENFEEFTRRLGFREVAPGTGM
jgi:hypothetical protein